MAGTRRPNLTGRKFQVRDSRYRDRTLWLEEPDHAPEQEGPLPPHVIRIAWGVVVYAFVVLAACVLAAWWIVGEGPGVRP